MSTTKSLGGNYEPSKDIENKQPKISNIISKIRLLYIIWGWWWVADTSKFYGIILLTQIDGVLLPGYPSCWLWNNLVFGKINVLT